MLSRSSCKKGFTIVELLVVVVIIAILAAVITVTYRGMSGSASESVLKAELKSGTDLLTTAKAQKGAYPTTVEDMPESEGITYGYYYNDIARSFCLSATSSDLKNKTFHTTEAGYMKDGACPEPVIERGSLIQTVTSANCPATRTMVVDARDKHSYWVQKLADNRCWMLTNLAYGGGGADLFNDVKSIQNGTGDAASTFTEPKYYSHPTNARVTTSPMPPSTSTNGGATSPQWGYFYNWCAATGVQASTSACANASGPAPAASTSVCPAGWRLPSGGSGGEFQAMATAIGATNNTSGVLAARETFLTQVTGHWHNGFSANQDYGYHWSSTQNAANSASHMGIGATTVNALGNGAKNTAFSVRCIAS